MGSLSAFPVELLAAVLDAVDSRCRLACMTVSKRVSTAARCDIAWKAFVEGRFWQIVPNKPFYALARELHFLRKNRCVQSNVISAALCASTTDDARQTVHETMNAKSTSFWSSLGAEDSDHTDYVAYLLGGSMSLIDRVTVTFFQADYQQNSPTYYASNVRILIGTLADCEDDYDTVWSRLGIGADDAGQRLTTTVEWEPKVQAAVERAHWHYESELFEVAQDPSPQTFQLPRLVAGTLLKVVLQGKVQKQVPIDDLYYVCLESLFGNGYTMTDLSDAMRSVALESVVSTNGGASPSPKLQQAYVRYLQFLATSPPSEALGHIPTPTVFEPSQTKATCDFYLQCNPPIRDHASRGADTPVQRLHRRLNLLMNQTVSKYGEELECPEDNVDEFRRDMDELRNIHFCYQQAVHKQSLGL
ncbi:F-box protein [Diplonema papillatum]|nr:F-box protein [Diplonema papillatum]